VVTCRPEQAAKSGGLRIGTVTNSATLIVEGAASISLADLRSAHEGWFPAYMAGEL
jgi:hypothetical protein